jgi:hypothetical protein
MICPNINAELLLLSRLEYTVGIVTYPLVVVVHIHYAASTKTCRLSNQYYARLTSHSNDPPDIARNQAITQTPAQRPA